MLSSIGLLCLSSTYVCVCVCCPFMSCLGLLNSLCLLLGHGPLRKPVVLIQYRLSTSSVCVIWRHGFERRLDWLTFKKPALLKIWIIVHGFMRSQWASIERVRAESVLVVACVRGQAAKTARWCLEYLHDINWNFLFFLFWDFQTHKQYNHTYTGMRRRREKKSRRKKQFFAQCDIMDKVS